MYYREAPEYRTEIDIRDSRQTRFVADTSDAGHAIGVPYRFVGDESPDEEHWLGGTSGANAHASADAWYHVLDNLRRGFRDRPPIGPGT